MTQPRMPRTPLPDPYRVEIVLDSVAPSGVRLTTFALTYPRFVHAELLTHRIFCLAGDAELEFDLPGGNTKGTRRIHKMTLSDFAGKWLHGSRPHMSRWGTERTYDLKPRLKEMRIRQLNEATGDIQTSTVLNVFEAGLKPVYEVQAGRYRVAGSLDHLVMTDGGYKTISEIEIGDLLVVCTRKKPEELKLDPLRLKKLDGKWRSVWQRAQRARLIAELPVCRSCKVRAGEEIHHIVPVWEAPDRAFDETNVTLLCDDCHTEQHRTQGWQTGVPLYSGLVAVDAIRFRGVEPTYDLEIAGAFPNFLANKVVVHNSRNSASSRAIPAARMRKLVEEHPALPVWWGKNQSGMQAREELDDKTPLWEQHSYVNPGETLRGAAKRIWLEARDSALRYSDMLSNLHEDEGLHKALCNRLTEPWMPITVLVSSTSYANWFHLRDHQDAQPELQVIATEMRYQYDESTPRAVSAGGWHLPYIRDDDEQIDVTDAAVVSAAVVSALKAISVGRCARVSYLTHDGRRDWREDVALHDKLKATTETDDPGHFSPFEHVAMALSREEADCEFESHRSNFKGWVQYRKSFPGEAGPEEHDG